MSHFAVMVIGDDVEGQLAPFQENNMGDCPEQYLTFNDVEDEYRAKYENESVEMIRCEDGSLAFAWDDRFKVGTGFDRREQVPPGLERVQSAHRDRYATFDEFMQDWAGHEERDAKTGRYGYWENPNRKWDWYSVGGRWSGWLRLRSGGDADTALKGEIDWGGMMSGAATKAAARYDGVMKLIGHLPPNRTWVEISDGRPIRESMREEYWSQPRCATWKAADRATLEALGCDTIFGSVDDFLISRDQYIDRARYQRVSCFAFLREGKWAERGEMGWWGCVSNENDAWEEVFWELLQQVPDTERVTVVDCHI